MRILIAEDERDLNRLLVKKLTAESYSVDACNNGGPTKTQDLSAAR